MKQVILLFCAAIALVLLSGCASQDGGDAGSYSQEFIISGDAQDSGRIHSQEFIISGDVLDSDGDATIDHESEIPADAEKI
jgi:uncharacterized protein YcfL